MAYRGTARGCTSGRCRWLSLFSTCPQTSDAVGAAGKGAATRTTYWPGRARGTQRPKAPLSLSAAPQPASMSSRETDWLDPSANVITAAVAGGATVIISFTLISVYLCCGQPSRAALLWSKHPSRRREVRRNALSRRRPGGGTMRVTHKRRGRRNIEGDSIGVECFKTSRERAGRGRARRPSAAAASPLLQQRERRFLL